MKSLSLPLVKKDKIKSEVIISPPEPSNKKYSDPVVNEASSEFEVNNWVLSEFIIDKIIPLVGVHPFPLNELLLMAAATCRFKPTHIFEWGTHIGKSARVFYETTKEFGITAKIYSIDLPDDEEHNEHPHDQRGALVKDKKRVVLIQGDGLKDSLKILKPLDMKKTKPLFFIDGDHSYESVKREFSGLIDVWPNGVFIFHDSFYQSKDSGYNVGPFDAINDVLASVPGKYKQVATNTGLPGMTLVYKVK